VYVCMYVFMYVRVYACMHYVYVHACMYVFMYVCVMTDFRKAIPTEVKRKSHNIHVCCLNFLVLFVGS
jgi:hypothetical protein